MRLSNSTQLISEMTVGLVINFSFQLAFR
jgi:hypothetical protein